MNDCKKELNIQVNQIPLYNELNSYPYAFLEISIILVCTIEATIIMQNCLCNVSTRVGQNLRGMQNY